MKFKLKHSYYASSTPKKMRKLGDAFLAAGLFIVLGGAFTIDTLKEYFSVQELKWIIGGSLALCIVGKILTNFFKEEDTPDVNPNI